MVPEPGNGSSLVQLTAIAGTCLGEFIGCTQVATTENGRIVGFDHDYIAAEQPFWAQEPELLALQLTPSTSDSAEKQIDFDDSEAPVITITTTGLLADSADATQLVVTTERADGGLLRFVSVTYRFRCVEGRGHQNFSVDPCL
jgi:hypothetical protein